MAKQRHAVKQVVPPSSSAEQKLDAESLRLEEDAKRAGNWKRWGPYLAERQWGTVREDYSAHGDCWNDFSHDQARSRAYRWGEDGLLGITDRQCRLCFALALWNGRDPILKERIFGLTNPQGNHGEDVKEYYFYLDSTPTHSYMKALYKYPQAEFPYQQLIDENRQRSFADREFELADTGVFDDDRYFDVQAEYAKASPEDLLIRITVTNRGPERASVHVLPTLWFRNTWSWGRSGEGYDARPILERVDDGALTAIHDTLGRYRFTAGRDQHGEHPPLLFTNNETNAKRLFNSSNPSPYVKDAFHEYLIHGRSEAVNPDHRGTKAAVHYLLNLEPGQAHSITLRLSAEHEAELSTFTDPPGLDFDRVFTDRRREADAFYDRHIPITLSADERNVSRQAYAGLLWTKQFFHYIVDQWRTGDPAQPAPPPDRIATTSRNADWSHVHCRDVISVCDKWEYPWFAAWDLAFHMIPMARIDPHFAKDQLLLFLREWYMHPNGQLPAYEFAFGDVNPPVHAWACWQVYQMSKKDGASDRVFLARAFHKLMLNFTWWVNRKDPEGKNIFAGGFLGLDNIGVFDRSQPLPTGGHLEQADGTAWMAFYCGTMLTIALELAKDDLAYEDVASKFFEHFVAIADAMNTLGGTGLWDEQDQFYYDQLHTGEGIQPLRVRSMVGLLPMIAVGILEDDALDQLPGFRKRLQWFLDNRQDLARNISYMESMGETVHAHHLLAIPSKKRLERVLRYLLDETEFLSPFGVRSLSKHHERQPYVFRAGEREFTVAYVPGESLNGVFGGNSNWRGPIWYPVNYLLIEALDHYHHFYGDSVLVECPHDSGCYLTLGEVADELRRRLVRPLLCDPDGRRPFLGDDDQGEGRFGRHRSSGWADLVQFNEYFHAETGRGLGASHQTGWTALAATCLESLGLRRSRNQSPVESDRQSGQPSRVAATAGQPMV